MNELNGFMKTFPLFKKLSDPLRRWIQLPNMWHFFYRYRPQILEMETKLKPFLPEFIPAVGDPDAFLKIDRPDGNAELLGLTVIDEPSVCRVFDFSFLID